MMTRDAVWLFLGLLGTPSASFGVMSGQVDNFENGTVMGWEEGFISPNPPTNVPSGGPLGAGDNYLGNQSSGAPGAGGRMVMFNSVQWSGDYISAGISVIQMHLANFGADTLFIRIAFEGSTTRYGSTTAVAIPPDSQWRTGTFSLLAPGLSLISGVATRETVLSGVGTMRILSAKAAPAWEADQMAGVLGVDNIIAVPQSGVGRPGDRPSRQLSSAPNPFDRATTLTYELPVDLPVVIDIHDITGRLMRRLMSGEPQSAGLHEAVWDGRDSAGARVSPGVYLARLSGPGYSAIHKLVVTPH